MLVVGGAARVLPTYPIGPIGSVLPFPNGDALLQPIDHQAARPKGFRSVRGAGCADHGDLADPELSHAMESGDSNARYFPFDFGAYAIHFGAGHARVGFVLQL